MRREEREGTISKAEVTNERERRERRMEKGARREERVAERDRVFVVVVVVVRNGLAFRENEVLRCGEDEGRRRDESTTGMDGIERRVRTSASQNSPARGLSKERDKVREREDGEVKGEGEVAEEAPCLSPSFEPLMLLSS